MMAWASGDWRAMISSVIAASIHTVLPHKPHSSLGNSGGTTTGIGKGPSSLSVGDSWSESAWLSYDGGQLGNATGVILRRGKCDMAAITDGMSNTYLAGETYLFPDEYISSQSFDDQG
jgi:hypothetical protein